MASTGTAPHARIAFLGLGQMGTPMARRLVTAGYDVSAFDLSPHARASFSADGGSAAASAEAACEDAEFVITMLPNGKVVRSTLLDGGAVEAAAANALVIDMSSSAPMQTRELADTLKRLGLECIDAPVSGGVVRAKAGTISIMAGGDPANIDRARPVLLAMGQGVVAVGPLGAGHMKALNNYVSAAGLVAACEAVIAGRAFGLDPQTIVDVLNASTGKNNSTETKMKPFVLSGTFGSGFSAALMAKDIATAAELCDSVHVGATGVHAAARLWREALDALGPSADHTAIYRYLADEAIRA
jgi:3-hydroxyisobutyrate dehydrogenase